MDIKKNLMIYVTDFCNYNCSFCQNKDIMSQQTFTWSKESTNKLEEILKENQFNLFCLTGGEPMLDIDSFKDIVCTIRKYTTTSSIVVHTNGSTLTQQLIRFCEKNNVILNISVNLTGEKDIYNLIKHSLSPTNIIKLIRSIKSSNKNIVYVYNRKEEFAKNAIVLHQIFDSNIRLYSNYNEWSAYDKTDISWFKSEWDKIQKYDPNAFTTWAKVIQFSYNKYSYEYNYRLSRLNFSLSKPYPFNENQEGLRQMDPNIKRMIEYAFEQYVPNTAIPTMYGHLKHITYTILTGLDCNLRCKYCYEHSKGSKINNIDDIKKFLDYQFKKDFGRTNADKSSIVILDFIGGEPLLHPELISETIQYALKLQKKYEVHKLRANLSTNGTLITRPNVMKLLDTYGYMLSIGFSIDGTKEVHNINRVDMEGNGSYDEAVKGFRFLKRNYPYIFTVVKATFNHQTIDKYAESVISLINLGFTEIAANVVYEENWNDCVELITQQFGTIIDYLYDNNLWDKIKYRQLDFMTTPEQILHYHPEHMRKTKNWCGACDGMTCIGFNKQVYGCQRFCTMDNPKPIGYLDDNTKSIVITPEGKKLIKDVKNQYNDYPQECKDCLINGQCASCSALPYEVFPEEDNPAKKFFALKNYCGWTDALVGAKIYFVEKYRALFGYPPLVIEENSTNKDMEVNSNSLNT